MTFGGRGFESLTFNKPSFYIAKPLEATFLKLII